MKNKILKGNFRGITLIALIITIIILLVLAGITISILTGNNGLLAQVKLSKEKSKIAQEEENVTLDDYEDKINYFIDGEDSDSKIDYSKYNDTLKLLYINANYKDIPIENGENNLPTTVEELVSNKDVFNWILSANKNDDYIINNSDIFMNDIVSNDTAMETMGKNEYISKKAIKNNKWRNAILSSTHLDKFNLGAKTVPTMTSNTSPEGEAFVSRYEKGCEPYRCFDGDDSTDGDIPRPYTLNGYIGYKFTERVVPYYVAILNYPKYYNYFSNIKIQGSNDNITWVDLTDVTSIATSGWIYIKLENDNAYEEYQYIRILQTTDKGSAYYAGAYTIQFYCR